MAGMALFCMGEDLDIVKKGWHIKARRRWMICVDTSDIPRNVLYVFVCICTELAMGRFSQGENGPILIKVANRARQDASASRLCAFRSSVLAVAADTGWVAANCRKSERGVTDTDRCHRWATALSSGVCGGRLLLHTIVQDVKVGVEFGEEVPSRKLFKAASAARLSRPLHRRTRHHHQRRASLS
jgi:hypothetical protein